MNSKDKLLREAIKLAIKQGYRNIKREDIAQKAKVSAALINFYYGTIQNLQKEVMRYAVKNASEGNAYNSIHRLVAQGLTLKDPLALKAHSHVKQLAANSII